jgi:hypothetical protein
VAVINSKRVEFIARSHVNGQLFPLGALGGPGTSSLFADREFTL